MYTAMKEMRGAVDVAAGLARPHGQMGGGLEGILDGLPLLVDRVMAEAGVVDRRVAARAISQSAGDLARAVSLIRAWAANLERVAHCQVCRADLRVRRRITPAFRAPPDGQYLGATMDYAQRLLDFGDPQGADADESMPPAVDAVALPLTLARALDPVAADGLVAMPSAPAKPDDRSRTSRGVGAGRGPLLQQLARSDTGALTALAYSGLRGFASQADPTLVELIRADAPVRRVHPRTGQDVEVGCITVTTAELALYRVSDGVPDARLTVGFGATAGAVEVRAIAAALLDGGLARVRSDGGGAGGGALDEEFVLTTLDQSEANGFVEHLKLPHHVTFSSDLDALRRVREQGEGLDTE